MTLAERKRFRALEARVEKLEAVIEEMVSAADEPPPPVTFYNRLGATDVGT